MDDLIHDLFVAVLLSFVYIRERLLSSVAKGSFPGAFFILHALVANLKSWIAAGGATGAGIASESTCWSRMLI